MARATYFQIKDGKWVEDDSEQRLEFQCEDCGERWHEWGRLNLLINGLYGSQNG